MGFWQDVFGKHETVFKEKNKPLWKEVRRALKENGMKGVFASSIDGEMPTCGCGAKLDLRDFGPNGKIDRSLYCIRVPAAESDRARGIIQEVREGIYGRTVQMADFR